MAISSTIVFAKHFQLETFKAYVLSYDHTAAADHTIPTDLPAGVEPPRFHDVKAIFAFSDDTTTCKVHYTKDASGALESVVISTTANIGRVTILILGS